MPKQSLMIQVNSEALKDAIQKRGALASLEQPLGVTKQAINAWLTKGKIPPRQLSSITRELKFAPEEMRAITEMPKEIPFILFRTNRNVAVEDSVKKDVLEVADDFFQLESLTDMEKNSTELLIKSEDPAEMAERILRQLNLKRSQLSISTVLTALKELNIHVLFFDFGAKFIGAKAQAVCVRKGAKAAIFINSYELIEDVLWRVFHEVCHLFSGHKNVTKKDEEFCNNTASQVVTPDIFFKSNKSQLKQLFSAQVQASPFIVEEIASNMSASFKGVIIGLKNHKIVDERTQKYLWKVAHNREKSGVRVKNIISPSEGIDHTKFWAEALEDTNRNKFLQLQHFVRMGVILNKISNSRAAELLNTDEMTMQQLGRLWLIQYEKKNNL